MPVMKTLNDVLTPDRTRDGWSLRQPNDHILELLYRGKVRAKFNQNKVTIENLEHEIGKISKN